MPHKAPAPRQLKVYPKYQERGRFHHVICPEIRLCGQWLEQLVFARGHHVTVQPGPGQIIITLNPQQAPALPPAADFPGQ